MNTFTCRTLGLAVALALSVVTAGLALDLRINEIRIDQPSTDTDE